MATKLLPALPGSTPPLPATIATAGRVAGLASSAPTAPRFIIRDGDDIGSNWVKICLYGATASGKTHVIIGLLLAGERVFVVSTDFGGSGLQTVKQWFKDNPEHAHLKANLKEIEFQKFEDGQAFLKAPFQFAPKLVELNPTVLFWDGFTGWQQNLAEEHIEDGNSARKAAIADFDLDTKNWAQVAHATMWPLNDFLKIQHPDGRTIHKIVTCAEDDGKEDKQTGQSPVGPLLHGVSRKMLQLSFDVIARTKKDYDLTGSKVTYKYVTDGDSRSVTKSRGFGLSSIEEADGLKFWLKIKERLA